MEASHRKQLFPLMRLRTLHRLHIEVIGHMEERTTMKYSHRPGFET